VQLTLRNAQGGESTFAANTLWHVILQSPDESLDVLEPALRCLNPAWEIRSTSEAVQRLLFAASLPAGAREQSRRDELVQQLGSPRFAERDAAQRALAEMGPRLLPYLQALDWSALDAEQRHRLQDLLAACLSANSRDEATTIARWLEEDPAVWYGLLLRAEDRGESIALAHLRSLLGDAVPEALSEDPAQRQPQLDAIRLLAYPPPAAP
jgi:hypothetical protein